MSATVSNVQVAASNKTMSTTGCHTDRKWPTIVSSIKAKDRGKTEEDAEKCRSELVLDLKGPSIITI